MKNQTQQTVSQNKYLELTQIPWNFEDDSRFGNMLRIARCRHALANDVLDAQDILIYMQQVTRSYSQLNKEDQALVDSVHPFTPFKG